MSIFADLSVLSRTSALLSFVDRLTDLIDSGASMADITFCRDGKILFKVKACQALKYYKIYGDFNSYARELYATTKTV
jgi:hypothetical protein